MGNNSENQDQAVMYIDGALAALSQPHTFPADVEVAKKWLLLARIELEKERKTADLFKFELDPRLFPE